MSVPIQVPQAVRRANGIPDKPLALFSVWAMEGGAKRGLWVGEAGSSTGRRWPITGVSVDEAQSWIDAAQGVAGGGL